MKIETSASEQISKAAMSPLTPARLRQNAARTGRSRHMLKSSKKADVHCRLDLTMNKDALQKAASLITKGNVNSNIDSVRVTWDDAASRLTVQYYVDGRISDDDRELCDLTCGELLSEFPEVRAADTECIPIGADLHAGDEAEVVYRRGVPQT